MQTSTWSAGFFDVSDSGHLQIASNFDSNMHFYDYAGSPSAPPLAVAPSYSPLSEPENETLCAAYAGAVSSTAQPLYDTASNSAADDAYKLIPQVPFAYRTTFSTGRYPADFEPHNVFFQMQGATHPGVTLRALRSSSHGLVDAGRPVSCAGMAGVITLRVKIPGLARYESRIHTWSKNRSARVTVENLAGQLERRMSCFFRKSSSREWVLGQGISDVSRQIVLIKFYRVTRGTWQVDLGLSRLPVVR